MSIIDEPDVPVEAEFDEDEDDVEDENDGVVEDD